MADASLSSPEQEDFDDDQTGAAWVTDHNSDLFDHHSPSSTTTPTQHAGSTQPSGSGPASSTQKRRRVTRACDECRRKKIKCDGRQPCTHCTVYSYECTYDQPSNRRRNPPPQYIEALENRMQRAEALLRYFVPDLDLSESSLDSVLQQGPSALPIPLATQVNHSAPQRNVASLAPLPNEAGPSDTELESMVKTTGLLDLDEQGHWDYTGNSANKTFLQNLRVRFGVAADPMQDGSIAPSGVVSKRLKSLESPKLTYIDSPLHSTTSTAELPSKEVALELCDHGLDDAAFILACVHKPSFYKHVDRIYDIPHDMYRDEDHKFLPLLYVVIALGRLFSKNGEMDSQRSDYKSAMDEAYGYFWAAKQLLDIAECRDLISLQAIVFMSLFLQCTAKLSTCYAYVGVAMRSALRMGLHRSFKDSFSPIEAELRKRCFWVIRRVDIHVGAMLGLPMLLSDEDIDQEYPVEVDDDYITDTEILPMPEGQVSVIAAANHMFRLSKIISKIVRDIYPIKSMQKPSGDSKSYSVSFGKIREIENSLDAWMESLPDAYKPGDETASPGIVRIRRHLRMSYAYVQMLLYRPFLHYVSSQTKPRHVDQGAYICSAACVSVSQNTIHITVEMMKEGNLPGSYWITMYTTFFAVLSLVYFVRENPSDANNKRVRKDASDGRAVLAKMAKRSWAADRCTITLNALFASLPDVSNPSPTRPSEQTGSKRRSDTHKNDLLKKPNHSVRSDPELADNKPAKHSKRASSFPLHLPDSTSSSVATSRSQHSMQDQSILATSHKRPISLHFASSSASPESAISPTNSFSPLQNQADFQSQCQPQNSSPSQPPNYYDQSNLSEISALMFPSNDPFAYPNQPLGSFERTSFDKHNSFGQSYGAANSTFMTGNNTVPNTLSADATIDGQLFSGFPPYFPGSQQQPAGDFGSFMGGNTLGIDVVAGGPNYMQNSNAGMWDPQGRGHGLPVNLNDIFGGGDWAGASLDTENYGVN